MSINGNCSEVDYENIKILQVNFSRFLLERFLARSTRLYRPSLPRSISNSHHPFEHPFWRMPDLLFIFIAWNLDHEFYFNHFIPYDFKSQTSLKQSLIEIHFANNSIRWSRALIAKRVHLETEITISEFLEGDLSWSTFINSWSTWHKVTTHL